MREQFFLAMPEPEPSTPAESFAKFMGFIASFVNDPKEESPCYTILRHILVGFCLTLISLDIDVVLLDAYKLGY